MAAPEGRQLLLELGPFSLPAHLLDRVYEGDQIGQLALQLGYNSAACPKISRLEPHGNMIMLYKAVLHY